MVALPALCGPDRSQTRTASGNGGTAASKCERSSPNVRVSPQGTAFLCKNTHLRRNICNSKNVVRERGTSLFQWRLVSFYATERLSSGTASKQGHVRLEGRQRRPNCVRGCVACSNRRSTQRRQYLRVGCCTCLRVSTSLWRDIGWTDNDIAWHGAVSPSRKVTLLPGEPLRSDATKPLCMFWRAVMWNLSVGVWINRCQRFSHVNSRHFRRYWVVAGTLR